MIVYRVCSESELFEILNSRNFDNVGRMIERDIRTTLNNHKYKIGKKYLHFFKDVESTLNLKYIEGSYLCTYNIPDRILIDYIGVGYYYYDEVFKISVVEYAIPTDLLNIKNFICYENFDYDKIINNQSKKKVKVR